MRHFFRHQFGSSRRFLLWHNGTEYCQELPSFAGSASSNRHSHSASWTRSIGRWEDSQYADHSSCFGGYENYNHERCHVNYTVAFAHPKWRGKDGYPRWEDKALFKSVIFETQSGDVGEMLLRIDDLEKQVAKLLQIVGKLSERQSIERA